MPEFFCDKNGITVDVNIAPKQPRKFLQILKIVKIHEFKN